MPDTPHITAICNARNILLLESDDSLAQAVTEAITEQSNLTVTTTNSAERAISFIEDNPDTFFAGAIALETENANKVLERLTRLSIRAITYGTDFDDDTREKFATWGISELILRTRDRLPAVIGNSMGHLDRNRNIAILVVDDSRSMRAALVRFLSIRCYHIHQATNGQEALDTLAKHPNIKLVITDNEMPVMDGFALVKEIRKTYAKDDLAVIGISAKTNAMISVKFINNGANDFLHKPFVKEELYCRVEHNVEMLNRIATIRELSYKDPLTRLYNRRYFFENRDTFAEKAMADGNTLAVTMVDIDHFKRFNDTYGHDAGDDVLREVSDAIADNSPDNAIVCRFGGEEFCILAAHAPDADIFGSYDRIRRAVENSRLIIDDKKISITISIGVCTKLDDIDAMIKVADAQLYAAKESGRNLVIIS